jgi:hypothetical protein
LITRAAGARPSSRFSAPLTRVYQLFGPDADHRWGTELVDAATHDEVAA